MGALLEIISVIIIVPIIYLIFNYALRKKSQSYRKAFFIGLNLKLIGGLSFALVYEFHYQGGDTTLYWYSSKCFSNLLLDNFSNFWEVLVNKPDMSTYLLFNRDTGYPFEHYFFNDSNAFFMMKIMIPFTFLGFNTYFGSTLLLAAFSYISIWKLAVVTKKIFNQLSIYYIILSFSLPSVIFWGSGILKDTFTLFGLALTVASFWTILIERRNILIELFYLIIGSYIVINLKPYVLAMALPLIAFIFTLRSFSNLKNKVIKFIARPLSIGLIGLLLVFLTNQFKTELSIYSDLDSIAEKAYIANNDLQRDAYKGNSFDIGEFDPTIQGMLSKFPVATIAGLFRPFIWEVNNVAMLISGLENLILLTSTIIVVIFRFQFFIRNIFSNYYIRFCVIFVVLFAFFIGVSTSNFGSLVRFRIPLLPFFSLFILYSIFSYKQSKKT